MNYIDFILFALLILGFVLGYKDGLIRKVVGLIGIFAGLFLAVRFSETAGKFMAPMFDGEVYFSELAAGVVIFILCIIAASIVKRLVHPHDKVNQLANQLLGGMTGTLQIAFFISCFLLITAVFNFPSKKTAESSLLYATVYNLVPRTVDMFIGEKKFFRDYIESKDKGNKRLAQFEKEKKEAEVRSASQKASKAASVNTEADKSKTEEAGKLTVRKKAAAPVKKSAVARKPAVKTSKEKNI